MAESAESKRKVLEHRRLAIGEATGHYHEADTGTLIETDTGLEFHSDTEALVKHQEHGPLTVPPDVYDRKIVREVDEDEEIRRVID